MFEKKSDKVKLNDHKARDDGVELESQLIMRFPKEFATQVHDAIQAGNVKDRLSVQLDQDLRYGEVRLDDMMLYAKLVDLPTVVESYKTIDNKSFYKSADICQLLICKTEPEDETEKESPNKNKKKDPNKVDKKYLWPHGITPPCKNVRKRRFRKTLKKKNVEAPEIEKEVKHLLRIDNEAVRVDFEIINEEDKGGDDLDQSDIKPFVDEDLQDDTMHASDKTMNESTSQRDINVESDDEETRDFGRAPGNLGVAAHDIFGEEVSTTDDEDEPRNNALGRRHELEESSRLSADDSRLSDFFGASGSAGAAGSSGLKMEQNEFSKAMFGGRETTSSPKLSAAGSSSNLAAPGGFYDNSAASKQREEFENLVEFGDEPQPQYTPQQIQSKIIQLRRQISDLRAQQAQKSTEIASIQNATLKQRMQEALDNIYSMVMERELELKDFENMMDS